MDVTVFQSPCSAPTVSSATAKNAMGGTVGKENKVENSAMLLCKSWHIICTLCVQRQVPCLRGNCGKGTESLKEWKALLQNM